MDGPYCKYCNNAKQFHTIFSNFSLFGEIFSQDFFLQIQKIDATMFLGMDLLGVCSDLLKNAILLIRCVIGCIPFFTMAECMAKFSGNQKVVSSLDFHYITLNSVS